MAFITSITSSKAIVIIVINQWGILLLPLLVILESLKNLERVRKTRHLGGIWEVSRMYAGIIHLDQGIFEIFEQIC